MSSSQSVIGWVRLGAPQTEPNDSRASAESSSLGRCVAGTGCDILVRDQEFAVEQQKAAIEIEYLNKVHEVKQMLYDMDTRRLLLEEELTLKHLGYKADEITARIAELTGQRKEIRDQGDESNDAAIRAVRENAANRTAQLVRDHHRQIFESLKQQAGGVFDALLDKSQSVWKAIGNSLKTALLTAINDVVTSRIAATLMQMFTGQKVTFAGGGAGPGGSGGMLGGLGGLLGIGAVPVFGGTRGGKIPGGAAVAGARLHFCRRAGAAAVFRWAVVALLALPLAVLLLAGADSRRRLASASAR